MNFFTVEAAWFLMEEERIGLSADVKEYTLDPEMSGVVGDIRYLPDKNDPNVSWKVKLIPHSDLLNSQSYGDDIWAGSVVNTGHPRLVSINPATHKMFVSPIPSTSDGCIEFIMTLESNVPSFSYESGAWVFYEPDGEGTLADSFENVWLADAYSLIQYRTISQLLKGIYGGSDMAKLKASDFEQLAVQEMNRLRVKHNRRSPAAEVPKNL